jgi:hypothetical protein
MSVMKIVGVVAVSVGMLTAAPAAVAAPPSNDDFEGAELLGDAPFFVAGTTADSTIQAGEPDHGPQSVWYAFQPSRTGRVALRLAGPASSSAWLRVYTGSSLSALTPTRVSNGPIYGRLMFDAVANQTYRVAVVNDPHSSASTFELSGKWIVPPPNDAFAGATPIRVPGTYRGSLRNATVEAREHSRNKHSLWYRFRPRRTARLTIKLALAAYDPQMQLYTGRKLSRLELVKRTGPSGERSLSPMRVTVRRGVLYHLAVDADAMDRPGFVLRLSSTTA